MKNTTTVLQMWVRGVGTIMIVLALWAVAAPSAGVGVDRRPVQTQKLQTSGHWVIQIVYLLLGPGTIGQMDNLGRVIKRNLVLRTTADQAYAVERAIR